MRYLKALLCALLLSLVFAVPAQATPNVISWYGTSTVTGISDGTDGQLTCSGAVFDSRLFTAAAGDEYPLGSILRVSWAGRSVDVLVTDCGGAAYGGRWDLSYAAASRLGYADTYGVVVADVQVVRWGPWTWMT